MEELALHTCCGPCLIEPLRLLREEFAEITAFYYNPNIHPADEYGRRRDTFTECADSVELPYRELDYDPQAWEDATKSTPHCPRRCEQCYRQRLGRVIAEAAAAGFTHFATTLTVSPYQQREIIDMVARELCDKQGLVYAGRDFSDHYPEATRRSRQLGMYRQNYCGCAPSFLEAQHQRATRRASR
ncbi:MAG: epoxyqueuosine reductase QueH [Actinomycetia bacterium]|nr:epoxyqueuosine reductase QueH [Actinomycetes bacterium]